MKKILLIATLLLPAVLNAQWTDEYGTWVSVGAKKSLGTQWSLGLEAEYRAQDNSRWAFGLDAGYKLNKVIKFGAGYTLLYNRRPEKLKGDPTVDDEYTRTPAYCYPRHRFIVEGTADKRFWKWLRISLRERYQLTYSPEKDYSKMEYTKVPIFDDDWNYLGDEWMEKKGWKFTPFASAELCNSVRVGDRFNVDKVRTAFGTSYKLNKQHEFTLGYVLTFVFNDDDELSDKVTYNNRIHAVSVGYNFKF